MEKCPYCAEEVQVEALRCRCCGERLDKEGRSREKKLHRVLKPIDQVEDWESYIKLYWELPPDEQASRWERLSIQQRQSLQKKYGINGQSKLESGKPGKTPRSRLQVVTDPRVRSLAFVIIVVVLGLFFLSVTISTLAKSEHAMAAFGLGFAMLFAIPATVLVICIFLLYRSKRRGLAKTRDLQLEIEYLKRKIQSSEARSDQLQRTLEQFKSVATKGDEQARHVSEDTPPIFEKAKQSDIDGLKK